MSDPDGSTATEPWFPAQILSDLTWTNRHMSGGWQRFFEARGVLVQSAPPTDPKQPWIPEEILSELAWTNRHMAGGWERFFEKRGVSVR